MENKKEKFLLDKTCSFKDNFYTFNSETGIGGSFSIENTAVYIDYLTKKSQKNQENLEKDDSNESRPKSKSIVKIKKRKDYQEHEETYVKTTKINEPIFQKTNVEKSISDVNTSTHDNQDSVTTGKSAKKKIRRVIKKKEAKTKSKDVFNKEEEESEIEDYEKNKNNETNDTKSEENEVNKEEETQENNETNDTQKTKIIKNVIDITPKESFIPNREMEMPEVIVVPQAGSPVKDVVISDIGAPKQEKTIPKPPEHIAVNESSIEDIIPAGSTSLFTIKLWPNKKNLEKYIYYDEESEKDVMFATRNGSIGSVTYSIFLVSKPNEPIAQVASNFTRSVFTATKIKGDKKEEICVVDFKSRMEKSPNRQFTVTIPKLPDDYIAEDIAMPISSKDGKLTFVPKPPKMKGGIFVLRFGGRVKMESIKNFILVPPEDHEKHIMVYGKETENTFVTDVFSPLTPLQAFSISLAQF